MRRVAPRLVLASVNSDEEPANGTSGGVLGAALSAHGRYVAFVSLADNLDPGDVDNLDYDAFVRDRLTGLTERVSVASDGSELPSGVTLFPGSIDISGDGRRVVFQSDVVSSTEVYVRDRLRRTTELVSVNTRGQMGAGVQADISADGRHVAFTSHLPLVPGDDSRHSPNSDVYVRHIVSDTTTLVTPPAADLEGSQPAISEHGRFVAFTTNSRLTGGDHNDRDDVYMRDTLTGRLWLCSVGERGVSGSGKRSREPSISNDGSRVAFMTETISSTTGSVAKRDVYVWDRRANRTRLVSVSTVPRGSFPISAQPALSGGGRFVAFHSTPLLAADTTRGPDVYVRDMTRRLPTLVSKTRSGVVGDGPSRLAGIAGDGRDIAFTSTARNFVPGLAGPPMSRVFVSDR